MINEQNTINVGKEWPEDAKMVASYLVGQIAELHRTNRALVKRLLEK
jgi:hypothetical protein